MGLRICLVWRLFERFARSNDPKTSEEVVKQSIISEGSVSKAKSPELGLEDLIL
jgi:hypothetical protein